MLRDWLRGAFKTGLMAAGLALLAAGPLFGQASTGKIQGRVTDAATGAPVAGAQVTVQGTTLGNITNDQGFYFINEVPAGLQDIRAQFIGYRPVMIEGERILAGQTTTLNFELEQTAVELETITVQGERNPLVPRDQTSTKSIVRGETVDELPLDNATSIVTFSPGVVQTNQGRTIRGSRPNEEAVFIDGVLVRGFGRGNADNVSLPTNALEQVDVNVGAFSAEYGEGQSGVVSFVTRSGGPEYTGSMEFMSDQVGPDSWRTNFNRLEATLGGPIAGPLTFFLAGTFQGLSNSHTQNQIEQYVINGVETCPSGDLYSGLCDAGAPATFQLPRSSATNGATDYVDVSAPNFIPWDNGATDPYGWSQNDLFTGNLNWQLPKGSRINFAYTWNRGQNYSRGTFYDNYRTDNYDGGIGIRNVFTLGWYQTITQTANSQLALDVRGSYQTDRNTTGALDPNWWLDKQDPFLGWNLSSVEFLAPDNATITGFDAFDPSEEYIQAYRTNAIPRDSMILYPQRFDLSASQSLTGLDRNLRYNPYGVRTDFGINGYGNSGISKYSEDRWQGRASVDWQIGRFNRVKFGAEFQKIHLRAGALNLYQDIPYPETAKPLTVGAFLQERLDIGDLVLEGGVRWDYVDTDAQYTRTPAYVFNVPLEWQRGFLRFDSTDPESPTYGQYVPKFQNADGTEDPCGPSVDDADCLSNFIDAKTKSEFSPRLGASFPVTPTSTFRLSYGRFVQTPAFFSGQSFLTTAGVSSGNVGVLQNVNSDLTNQNTNIIFGRDVDLPSTRQFEFGYRQLIGQDLVVDVSAFNKKQRNALAVRKLPFEDPTRPGATVYLNVVTNLDFGEQNGFEVKVDKAIGNLFNANLSYSYIDARGTGSDPFTYTSLILRAVSNLALLTGAPENPPEALLRLEQSRTHTIGLTTSLTFPVDYRDGTVAGALLQDLGLFTVLSVRSGLPYTKLINTGRGQIGPPSRAGLEGRPESAISGLETPWTWNFDLRLTKGFQIGRKLNLQAFVDWRNPFNLTNTTQVFLETASTLNEQWRTNDLLNYFTDSQLDNNNDINDFDILSSPDNDFNKYMLLRAEERFGNGDGVFTVAEQDAAFGQLYEHDYGQDIRFDRSDQFMRLGLRLAF